MINDKHYLNSSFTASEKEQTYGKNVHILNDPFLFSSLVQLGSPDCRQPLVNQLLDTLYRGLARSVVNQEFPKLEIAAKSRMHSTHPEGEFKASVIDPSTKVVCVNLARAGTVPSQICYDVFNYLVNPEGVRQDHISINRKIDETEKVTGTNLSGYKIGGDINNRFVLIPDPMGATGSTIKTTIDLYSQYGKPRKFIAIHLIVTPEYLSLVTRQFPDIAIYALRLDRGLSCEKVFSTIPGTFWNEEKGLNNKQYIIPGAGGLGEVINNSYV